MNEVLRFLFFDVSTPIKSVNGLSPILNLLQIEEKNIILAEMFAEMFTAKNIYILEVN